MNAIICLAHFCEQHGPRVVFCTETVFVEDWVSRQRAHSSSQPASKVSDTADGKVDGKAGEEENDAMAVPKRPRSESKSVLSVCASCRSLEAGACFATFDANSGACFVSTARPENEKYSRMQEICLRSLTHEVCTGMEGPIFFGDETLGYALSYLFKIADSKARGYCRLYSFIVMLDDHFYLVNSWDFLNSALRALVLTLQARGRRVFASEDQRPAAAPVSRSNMLMRRQTNVTQRSLGELVNMQNIFANLHGNLSWILRGSGRRLFEIRLQGRPLVVPELLHTMDFPAGTKRGRPPPPASPVPAACGSPRGLRVSSLRELAELIGPAKLPAVVYNIIIGNQVVVRGDHAPLVQSILKLGELFLPAACVRLIPFSNTYEDSWKCNFLGLLRTAKIPPHVSSGSLVLVDVSPAAGAGEGPGAAGGEVLEPRAKDLRYIVIGEHVTTTLGTQLVALLDMAPTMSEAVQQRYLSCLQLEWMNKAKAFLQFSKLSSLSGRMDDAAIKRFLKAFNLLDADLNVLRFWVTALGPAVRGGVLNLG